MIIDFHTHSFPDSIAGTALSKLSATSDAKYYRDGTLASLVESNQKYGIDLSILLPVATSPKQHESINKTAIETNEKFADKGIISFGGIHPLNDNYKDIINSLAKNGIKGIKLHPVFQNVNFDDILYKNIIYYATERDMIVITHAGYDISYPGQDFVTPNRILSVIKDVSPTKLVLAHMGGWNCWDDVEKILVGQNVWFDTAFSISKAVNFDGTPSKMAHTLGLEQFIRIVRNHGADKILFGTDSPWTNPKDEIALLQDSGLTTDELDKIFYANAQELL